MRSFVQVLSLLLCSVVAFAGEVATELQWTTLREAGHVKHGVIVPTDAWTPFESLRVASTGGEQMTVEVMVLEAPGIKTCKCALAGEVRHDEVQGKAYLELWAHFRDGGFSSVQTLANGGPARHLEGTSGWQQFALLFPAPSHGAVPEKLVLSVAFPGAGTVWLGNLRIVEYPMGRQAFLTLRRSWVAAAVASVVALLAQAVLLRLIFLARARRAVMTGLVVCLLLGICLTGLGAVSVALRDLRALAAPALVVGVLLCGPAAVALPWARRHYGETELRRMAAMDAP